MPPPSLKASEDKLLLTIGSSDEATQFSSTQLDGYIYELVRHRSEMLPVHSAEPRFTPGELYTGDNLLWCVRPSEQMEAIELCVQHPGIGWIVLILSRAQVEDLQTSIEFALNYVGRSQEFRRGFQRSGGGQSENKSHA